GTEILKIELTRSKQMRKYFLIASFSPLFAIRGACGEEFVFAGVVWLRDDFLEAHAEPFEQGDGGLIGGRGDGDNALQVQSRPAVVHHGGGGFPPKTAGPEFLQEREADVHVLEPIALEQAAEAESEFAIARHGASGDVAASVCERARAAIADIFEEGRLVQKFQDERGVVLGEAAQHQPFCFQNFHRGDVSIFSRHISECARPLSPDSVPPNLIMDCRAARFTDPNQRQARQASSKSRREQAPELQDDPRAALVLRLRGRVADVRKPDPELGMTRAAVFPRILRPQPNKMCAPPCVARISSSDVTPVAETDAELARGARPALVDAPLALARVWWRDDSAEDARRNRHPSLWWAE